MKARSRRDLLARSRSISIAAFGADHCRSSVASGPRALDPAAKEPRRVPAATAGSGQARLFCTDVGDDVAFRRQAFERSARPARRIEISFEYLIPTRQAVCASRSAARAHLSVIAMRSDGRRRPRIANQGASELGSAARRQLREKVGHSCGQRRRADNGPNGGDRSQRLYAARPQLGINKSFVRHLTVAPPPKSLAAYAGRHVRARDFAPPRAAQVPGKGARVRPGALRFWSPPKWGDRCW